MKKELIILFLLFIPIVLAGTVTLNSPINSNLTNTTSITFSCTAEDSSLTITSIALYTNASGSMSQVSIDSTGSSTVTFTETLTPKSYLWNCLATFSDSSTAEASSPYTLTIHALDYSGSIPNQTIVEDSDVTTAFDLDTYFSNALGYRINGNNSINLTINSNNEVLIKPNANFSGTQNITITGYYNSISVTSNQFLINITAVNDNPYKIANIPNQSITKDSSIVIDMNQYFSDIDSTLNYTINSSLFSLNKTSSFLTITPISDFIGTKEVTITATDGSLTSISNSFFINVSTTNNTAPVIVSYTPDSNPIIELGTSQLFSIVASDNEGNSLTYLWTLDSKNVSTTDRYTFITSEEGTFSLTVIVSDETLSTTNTWLITVGSALITEESVASILSQGSSNSICGNNIPESDETCSSCALDVICPINTICVNGICQQKESAIKAILIIALITLGITGIGILIYYIASIKSTKNKPQPFQYRPSNITPSASYTDFYKKK